MKLKVSLIQTCSGKHWKTNLEQVFPLMKEALSFSPYLISLPEVVNLMNRNSPDSVHFPEEEDPSLKAYRDFAAENNVNIHIGSLGITSAEDPSKQMNRSYWIAANGEVVARYDKIHLFDVKLNQKETYRESDLYQAGNQACLIKTEWGKIGLTICYDLRFSYLYRALAQEGANVIFVPAAFTKLTGQKHWHTLLKARAIECHSFIIAAAQGGKHEDGRLTYGHSLVVSPDGEILAELPHDKPGVLNCEIETDLALNNRLKIPSLESKNFTMEIFQF